MKQINLNIIFFLKIILVLITGALLTSNWFFIATVILQDAMMGSGLFANVLAVVLTFLFSNWLFKFNKKWILSAILTVLSFYVGSLIENLNFTYRDSNHYIQRIENKKKLWKQSNETKQLLIEKKNEFYSEYIVDLITHLKSEKYYEYVSSQQMSKKFVLIYPTNLDIIICPINVKEYNKDTFIRYFAFVRQKNESYKLYEWNYLDPMKFNNTRFGPSLIDQIKSLTEWNFSFNELDDNKFWDTYVLIRENKSYKYLKEISF